MIKSWLYNHGHWADGHRTADTSVTWHSCDVICKPRLMPYSEEIWYCFQLVHLPLVLINSQYRRREHCNTYFVFVNLSCPQQRGELLENWVLLHPKLQTLRLSRAIRRMSWRRQQTGTRNYTYEYGLAYCQICYSSVDANGRSSWLSWLARSASLVSISVHFTSHPVTKAPSLIACKFLYQAVSPLLPRPKPVLVWPRGACRGKSEARKAITLGNISNTNIIPAEIGTNHPKMLQVH